MPRISPKLLIESLKIHRALPHLLPVCRSLNQAQLELNWIQNELPSSRHVEAILQRSNHVPLQYILGNQPFGNLDIICEPGVLIPRNDTEEWCFELVEVLKTVDSDLKVLDMCTGTGCIPLLLTSELPNMTAVGVDISDFAVQLAKRNYEHNKDQLLKEVKFCHGDLFDANVITQTPIENYDLVVSNPPYIPDSEFNIRNGMERSVRLYEPRLALLGDVEVFDSLITNCVLGSNCNGFIFELAGKRQVDHVMNKVKTLKGNWEVGFRVDSNNQYRNVFGWKTGTNMSVLANLNTSKL